MIFYNKGKTTMETFIIRIYRRFIDKTENILGFIEHVETGEKKSFENLQQLNGIILDSGSASEQYERRNNPKREV